MVSTFVPKPCHPEIPWVFDACGRQLGHNRLKRSRQTFSGMGSAVPENGRDTQDGLIGRAQLALRFFDAADDIGLVTEDTLLNGLGLLSRN